MKGAIQPNHLSKNKYELLVLGYQTMLFTKISEMESELETVDLPDRTTASGGNLKAIEFTVEMPAHHTVDQAQMEQWYRDSQDPVQPTYKKIGTLIMKSIDDVYVKAYSLTGLYPCKRGLGEKDMSNEGEMEVVTWTMKADDMIPLGA